MGVDVADQFLDGQIPALGQGERGLQLGDVGTDQLPAEQLPVRAIGDDFGEPRWDRRIRRLFRWRGRGIWATAMSLPCAVTWWR